MGVWNPSLNLRWKLKWKRRNNRLTWYRNEALCFSTRNNNPSRKNTQIIPSVGTSCSLLYSVTTLFFDIFCNIFMENNEKNVICTIKSWELADWLIIDRRILHGVSMFVYQLMKNGKNVRRRKFQIF
jgi:hypothetical protein